MRTHSCGRRAPIGCMARNPGRTRSTIASVSSTSAMRGSESKVAVSGGGTGRSTSQVAGTRVAGSSASRSCRIVVPVRPWPTITMGGTMSTSATSGCAARWAVMFSRSRR